MSWRWTAAVRMALGLVAVWPVSSSSARAQTPGQESAEDRVERARALFAEGVELADHRRWDEAATRFREADRLRPSPAIELNLALSLVQLRRFSEADALLARVIVHDETTERLRRAARRERDEIRPEVEREAAAAERSRETERSAPAPAPPPRSLRTQPRRTDVEERDDASSSGATVGWVVGATSIGAGLVAGAAGVWALVTDGECAGGRRDADGDCERIHDRVGGGVGLLVGAGVGIAAGTIVILLMRGDGRDEPREDPDGIEGEVTATPLPGGLAIGVRGRM